MRGTGHEFPGKRRDGPARRRSTRRAELEKANKAGLASGAIELQDTAVFYLRSTTNCGFGQEIRSHYEVLDSRELRKLEETRLARRQRLLAASVLAKHLLGLCLGLGLAAEGGHALSGEAVGFFVLNDPGPRTLG